MSKPRKPFARFLVVCAAVLLVARGAWAQTPVSPEASSPPAEPAPRAPAPSGATLLQSRDGHSALKLNMGFQADLRLPQAGSGLESTFLVRRARVGLTGTLAPFVDMRLIADFALTPIIQDAWLDLSATPWLRLRAGRLKVPFGYEWLETSASNLDFVERSLVFTLLLPRYDQGVALHGELGEQRVEYWLGLFNGAGSKLRDEDSGKMVAGRLAVSPVEGISLAVSGTHALGENLPEEVRSTLSTGQDILPESLSGLWVVPPQWRLGADAVSYLGPSSLKVEYAHAYSPPQESWQDEPILLPGLRSQALYASGTVVLTGEQRTDKGVVPSRPFDPSSESYGAGAWELGVRYGFAQLHFEALGEEQVHELTAGLNWYLNRSTRWVFNVSRYTFSHDPHSFHEFLMRVQWTF